MSVGKFFEKLKKIGRQSDKPDAQKVARDEDGAMARVPSKIHYFWQGPVAPFLKHVNAINETAEINNKNYQIRLHVLPVEGENISFFEKHLNHVKVKDLRKERWFADFSKTPRHAQFQASREGGRAHPASGADVIKSELIQSKGGIWNDVDNRPLKPLPMALSVPRGKVLTAGPVTFDRWGGAVGFHSSSFATHRDNPALKIINRHSFTKFSQLKDIIYQVHPRTDNPDEHFRMISETAGSMHMSSELMHIDPSLREEVEELTSRKEGFNQSLVIFNQYFEPVVTTGPGRLDDRQLESAVQAISGPGAVFADDPSAAAILQEKAKRGEKTHIVI
ncbi:hypothetical protein ACVWZP_001103 [Pseudomonas sp. TE36184]